MTRTELRSSPITENDLQWWIDLIPELDWAFAVTYAEGAPHEYICDRTPGITPDEFVRAARVIHAFGEPQKFYRRTRIYLVHDGWKYWTMEKKHTDVMLINRGRADHVYGPQNAPRTATAAPSPYDRIAGFWDDELGATDEERDAIRSFADELGAVRSKLRTLDIGAGTGLALDLGIAEPIRLTAIDSSRAMLNELVRKHPLVARVEPAPLRDVRARRSLGGTRFDLMLALGGAASYLEPEDWMALEGLGRDRFLLTAYRAGEHPPTIDLSHEKLESARSALREFARSTGGRVERFGRFEAAVVSA